MLEAVFTANVDEIKVGGLTQWDRGQLLQISCPGLPFDFQVHFTNRARGTAIPVQAVGVSNAATVAIPDEILREPFEVLAYIYFTEGDAGLIGETVKMVRMPITPRAQPEDYVLDLPQEQLTDAEMVIDKMMDMYATEAANAATAGALASIRNALNGLPAGSTLVINDLTTGGTAAALSAEMGKALGRRPNPNLLHNWYFANVVNQRGQAEYTGNAGSYTADRWVLNSKTAVVTVVDGEGIRLYNTVSGQVSWSQKVDNYKHFIGKTLTASVLVTEVSGTVALCLRAKESGDTTHEVRFSKPGVYSVTRTIPDDADVIRPYFVCRTAGASATFVAVKLELGDTQTLAHQNANGNLMLNEIPDYGAELAKCQRYYQLFSSENARPTALTDYRPTMRANPATGTINIDGVTYYYADAEL